MEESIKLIERCNICKISYIKGKKHVFGRRHQEAVAIIVQKFVKKVARLSKTLKTPVVHDSAWENGRQFWCPFCEKELAYHYTEDSVCIENGDFFIHLSSKEHGKNVSEFWKMNKVNKDLKSKVVLADEKIDQFESMSETAMKEFKAKREEDRNKMISELRNQEQHRQMVVAEQAQMVGSRFYYGLQFYQLHQSQKPSSSNAIGPQDPLFRLQRVRTVAAKSDGLTCVSLKHVDESRGNVHTGATPPWLIKSEQRAEQSTAIGPTFETYQNHLTKVKKATLPATRVGAKFDHSEAQSANWLPTFGRVWSKNRKSNIRNMYMKSAGREPAATTSAPVPATQSIAHCNQPSTSAYANHFSSQAPHEREPQGYRRPTSNGVHCEPSKKRIKISSKLL